MTLDTSGREWLGPLLLQAALQCGPDELLFPFTPRRFGELFRLGMLRAGLSAWPATPKLPSSLRPVPRSPGPSALPSVDQAQGRLAGRCERAKIREVVSRDFKTPFASAQARQVPSNVRLRDSRGAQRHQDATTPLVHRQQQWRKKNQVNNAKTAPLMLPSVSMKHIRRPRERHPANPCWLAVEVFSGCGRLSKALRSKGWTVIEWDIVMVSSMTSRCRTTLGA